MATIRHILIADDDEEDRFLLSSAFKNLHLPLEIYQVENGIEVFNFLNAIQHPDKLPALILLDYNMPFLTGAETLVQLKTIDRYKDIPVIIHTTSTNEKDRKECMEHGAAQFLPKASNYNQLLSTAHYIYECCQLSVA
jgi:CheY-like chemotaxis protein